MSEVSVGTRMQDTWFTDAGASLLLPASTSKSGIVRAALAIFQGMTVQQAKEYANPPRKAAKGISGTTDRVIDIACKVPEELAQGLDEIGASYAIRIGTMMAMGYSRDQAERAAKRSPGRPRKSHSE